MDLNIFIIFTLFAGAHSLKCYECRNKGCLKGEVTEKMCSPGHTCVSTTAIQKQNGLSEMKGPEMFRGCNSPEICVNGSYNFGVVRAALSAQCCKTDLCNNRNVPDYSSNRPNGKQCYYCDGKNCLNKLNCLDTEDYCITIEVVNITSRVKVTAGCVSKYVCDAASKNGDMMTSCCQGNLCNSAKSNNHSLLILSCSFIYYIIMFQLYTLQ